jgi:hypothetical protein
MSKPLTVIKSIALTDAMLTATSLAEADYAAWSAGTAYAVGARVIVASVHKVYESIAASNTGHDPVTSSVWWVEVGPTNRWKPFDLSSTSQMSFVASAYYEITPSAAVNAVGLINIAGVTAIRIRLSDPVFGVVYDQSTDLIPAISESSWYAWFFEPRQSKDSFIALDLPSYPIAVLRIDLTTVGTAYVGGIVFGYQRTIGQGVQYGARLGIQDYSRKERNTFGDVQLVQRAYALRNSLSMMIDNEELDNTARLLAELRSTPCIWIASDRYESLVIFGFYSSFEILISYPQYSQCTLDIEGMT